MGEIWIKEFVGGLDTRRMAETTQGGALVRAQDGHINRGGEFEQRAAFVKLYTLLPGTTSLAAGVPNLYVFGHTASETMPSGVRYQRLRHPDGSTALTRILSYDLFSGLIYAVAEFADGSIHHFYDEEIVEAWNDGRARVSFRVTGGTASPQSKITGINAGSVPIIGNTDISWATSDEATATNIAARINAFAANYTADADGDTVTITRTPTGSGDGTVLTVTTTDGFEITSETLVQAVFAGTLRVTGGSISPQSKLTELKAGAVDVIDDADGVEWKTTNAATAAAIAAAINAFNSTPEYTATAAGSTVKYTTPVADDGVELTATVEDGLVITSTTPVVTTTMTFTGSFVPGGFARTVGSKVYAIAGSVLHFSGIRAPTAWTTDSPGAGFIDMASIASGAEALKAVEEYQEFIAIFAERVTLVYFIDPDPTLYRKTQTLHNTGTVSAKSVVGFGDADIFYLDASGIRSLKARDASNAASTTDIGVPIDTLIVEKLQKLSQEEKDAIKGLIEPTSGRFWLVMKDIIYVFSYFAGSKVSAWSTYLPTYTDEDGVAQAFEIDDAVVSNNRVYLRSGNDIFVYGGPGVNPRYDATEPELWTPYLDGGKPSFEKTLSGVDLACEGLWEIRVALYPKNPDASDKVGTVDGSTFNDGRIPAEGTSTHISLRLKGKGTGFKKIGSALLHYKQDDEES